MTRTYTFNLEPVRRERVTDMLTLECCDLEYWSGLSENILAMSKYNGLQMDRPVEPMITWLLSHSLTRVVIAILVYFILFVSTPG